MKVFNEQRAQELYKTGMSRLQADKNLQNRILEGIPSRPRSRFMRLVPVFCASACVFSVLFLFLFLIPLFAQNLITESGENSDYAARASAISSLTSDSSESSDNFLVLRIQESSGRLTATLQNQYPYVLQESGQTVIANASSEKELVTAEGLSAFLDSMQKILLESSYSGNIVVSIDESLTLEHIIETESFLLALDTSSKFTVLCSPWGKNNEDYRTSQAWAKLALTEYLAAGEEILMEPNAQYSLPKTVLEEPSPISFSYGFPAENGSRHTGIDYSVQEGETILSPADGVLILRRGDKAVLQTGTESYVAIRGLTECGFSEGDAVSAGNRLGKASGNSLHLSILHEGAFVNPSLCIGAP